MQSKFKVILVDGAPKIQHTRKPHTKSRNGCNVCKQRRTKCDEKKPACDRCIIRNTTCVYESPARGITTTCRHAQEVHSATVSAPSSRRESSTDGASPNTDVYNLSLAIVRDRLNDTLPPGARNQALHDLQHFQAETALTLGFGKSRVILSSFVSESIWQYPFLMYSILAVANSHSKRLYAFDQEAIARLKIAEAGHWQCALHSYRKEVQRIQGQRSSSTENTDAVFATALLSVVFTFATDDQVSPDLFDSADEERLKETFNPFMSTVGFQALISSLPYMDISPTWEDVLESAGDEDNSFTSKEVGIDNLPVAFVRLCGLTDKSTSTNNVYHTLLRTLTPLLLLKPGPKNMPKLFAFIGRVWRQCESMFLAKDAIALLFLSWWLAQMRQLDLWWITTRARSQCEAIVNHLSSYHQAELLPFLEYPASFGATDISWIWHDRCQEVATSTSCCFKVKA